jgi:hypothetical protein
MRSFPKPRRAYHPGIVTETSEVARMDEAHRGSSYHLGPALGARDSCNRVSWLSAHLLYFPAHEAYRKEAGKLRKQLGEQPLYDPSPTLSRARMWGPSTRNILRSMEFAASGEVDTIEDEAKGAAKRIWANPAAISEGYLDTGMPQSEGSSIIFLRRTPDAHVKSDRGRTFIPTPYLRAIFEGHHQQKSNRECLDLVYALSSHALTRGTAGWAHERSVHELLGTGSQVLSVFRGHTKQHMRSSTHLLPGTLAGLKDAGANDSFYWIPSVANFPGIDGVLGDRDGNIYTIQATIARHHKSPLKGIKKVWEEINPVIRTTHTWHFVIITDSKEAADAYQGKFSSEVSQFRLGKAKTKGRVQFWTCVLRP